MGERSENVGLRDIGQTLHALEELIAQRRRQMPDGSYTASLLAAGPDKPLKKLAEEVMELGLAVKDGDHEHVRYEAGDVLFHLLVVLELAGVPLDELAGELHARAKQPLVASGD